jgi:hypothetical protein
MAASAWAVAKAEAVCADSVWTDELVARMAVALDEAEARGAASLRERIREAAERQEREAERLDGTRYFDANSGEYRHAAQVLRELLLEEG